MSATPVKDGWDLLTRITAREIQFCNVVFALRVNGMTATTAAVAGRFKNCSQDLAASVLYACADAGALARAGEEWIPTTHCLKAMRVHYRNWSEAYSSEDEARALAAPDGVDTATGEGRR